MFLPQLTANKQRYRARFITTLKEKQQKVEASHRPREYTLYYIFYHWQGKSHYSVIDPKTVCYKNHQPIDRGRQVDLGSILSYVKILFKFGINLWYQTHWFVYL